MLKGEQLMSTLSSCTQTHITAQTRVERPALRRCSRCVLPHTFPRISFDEQGVCNYCREEGVPTALLGEGKLLQVIRSRKQKASHYDCMVALSGGRDSTYAMYFLVRKLGLKVLAYSVDNGFMPAETISNINNAASILGVDHVWEKHNELRLGIKPVLTAWMHHPRPEMLSSLCLGCRSGFAQGLLRAARKYKTITVITGCGEPGSDEHLGLKFFTAKSFRKAGGAIELLAGYARELLKNPRYLSTLSVPYLMVKEYTYKFAPTAILSRLVSPGTRQLGLYRFIPWDENKITQVICNELGWKKPSFASAAYRSDSEICALKSQLYLKTLGFTINDVLVSGMIRKGLLTRSEALAKLEVENVELPSFLVQISNKVGVKIDLNAFGSHF
jgi:hypothetical protein